MQKSVPLDHYEVDSRPNKWHAFLVMETHYLIEELVKTYFLYNDSWTLALNQAFLNSF